MARSNCVSLAGRLWSTFRQASIIFVDFSALHLKVRISRDEGSFISFFFRFSQPKAKLHEGIFRLSTSWVISHAFGRFYSLF